MNTKAWTAEPTMVNGARLVAVRLTDGALVYLDPEVASEFGRMLIDAAFMAKRQVAR